MKLPRYGLACVTIFSLFAVFFQINSGLAQESTLRVGTAEVDITPHPGLCLSGYAARKDSVAKGALDPLYARALILEGKEGKVALIVLDLIGNFEEEKSDRIRFTAKASYGIEDVIFIATHTHSGPNFGGRASVVRADWFIGQ